MRLTGQLLQIEEYSGDFNDSETGKKIAYHGQRLHVLDGVEVIKVKVTAKDSGLAAGYLAGDKVDLRVQVTAEGGARGSYLAVKLLGDYVDAA